MKTFISTVALLSLCAVSVIAQTKGHQIPYSPECSAPQYCQDCTDTRPFLKGQNLNKYFSSRMNWKKLEDITGVVILDVVIGSDGRPCVTAIHNHTLNTDQAILELGFDNVVNDMPNWKPGTKDGAAISTIISIGVYCQVKNRNNFEVRYARYGSKIRWEPANGNGKKQVIDGTDLDDGFDKEEKVIRK